MIVVERSSRRIRMELFKRWKDDLWDPMNGFERLRDDVNRLSGFRSHPKTRKNLRNRKRNRNKTEEKQ